MIAHAGALPAAFQGILDDATRAKSVQYTLARSRLSVFDDTWRTLVLTLVLFGGALPRGFELFRRGLGDSAASQAAFLFATGVAMALPGLPVEWFEQFRLEERFGLKLVHPKDLVA